MTNKSDSCLVIHDSTCTDSVTPECQPINKTELAQAAADVKTKTDGVVQLGSLDAAGDPEILRRGSFCTLFSAVIFSDQFKQRIWAVILNKINLKKAILVIPKRIQQSKLFILINQMSQIS